MDWVLQSSAKIRRQNKILIQIPYIIGCSPFASSVSFATTGGVSREFSFRLKFELRPASKDVFNGYIFF